MDINKFEASLLKAMEGMQEAVAAMKEEPVSTPIARVLDSEPQSNPADFIDQTSVRLQGKCVHTEAQKESILRGQLEKALLDLDDAQFTEVEYVRAAVDSMVPHANGTWVRARAMADLMVAMYHWHGVVPDTEYFADAVKEMENLDQEVHWYDLIQEPCLFEEPSQALFWRTCDYATLHAALKDGAVYATEEKVPAPEIARFIGTAVSEMWGNGNGRDLGIAFQK